MDIPASTNTATRWKRSDIPASAVLDACRRAHSPNPAISNNLCSLEHLCQAYPDTPWKVLYAAMEREASKGRINYGVSLATAWVEPGKETP